MKKRAMLIILDGWGLGRRDKSNAIYQAGTPNMDALLAKYPNAALTCCGEEVGLPGGQMGNSEVGHLTIGAGRVIYQDLVRINKAIKDNSISKSSTLTEAFTYAKKQDKQVHFIGLIGPGGVHAMSSHLYKLCDLSGEHGLKKVFIHCLTDGRDTDPKSGYGYMQELVNHLEGSTGTIASLIGRYYTMDRDKRWERVREGYDLMVHGKGQPSTDVLKAIKSSYQEGLTDEFIKPTVIVDDIGKPVGTIQEGDVVICFNYRTDRLRQITTALTQHDIPEFGMKAIPLHYLTMTNYDESYNGVRAIFEKQNVDNTLGEIIARQGLSQLRIAETEKYAHVTFFFNGGREEEFRNENRILVSSPKVATYDLKPEMSAFEVKEEVIRELQEESADFVCLNFANGDMVGHTGIYPAIEKAVRAVDACVGEVVAKATEKGYSVIIIADHGNADYALNDDGSPNTAHSLNPVPCIVINHHVKSVKDGSLADVAPSILKLMGLKIPPEMTGKALFN